MLRLLDAEAAAIMHLESTGDATMLDAVQKKITAAMHKSDKAAMNKENCGVDPCWEALCGRVQESLKRAREDHDYRDKTHRKMSNRKCSDDERLRRLLRKLDAQEDEESDAEDLAAWDEAADRPPLRYVANGLALKQHQREAVDFARKRLEQNMGAILALAMGLGKTATALYLINELCVQAGALLRVLVLCPPIVTSAWKAEHDKFASQLGTHMFEPLGSTKQAKGAIDEWRRTGGILVFSFDMLKNVIKARSCILRDTDVLVLDELHVLKGLETERTKAILKFETKLRLGLTGTPLQNDPMDYYNIVKIVDDEALGITPSEFQRLFATPIVKGQYFGESLAVRQIAREKTAVLRSLMQEVVFHASSNILNTLLPGKVEFMLVYSYDKALAAQFDCGGNYLGAQARVDEALRKVKVELVDDMLAGVDDAAIVFSEHPETLRALSAKLKERARIIHGQVPAALRKTHLEEFAEGVYDVLLLSLGAASTGINCQRASTVIIMDPSENPTRDAQAVCRAYRIGQTRQVTVYRLAAENTVDMRVMQRGVVKVNMAHNLLNTQHIDSGVSRKDLVQDTTSVQLTPAAQCKDPIVRSVAHRLCGWTCFDSFFTDTENDTTDQAEALNKYHIELNQRARVHTFEDGTKVEVDKESLSVIGPNGDTVLLSPPIPIVNCQVDRTIIELWPVQPEEDAKFEVVFKRVGGEWNDTSVVVKKRKFFKRRAEGDDNVYLQCRSRLIVGDMKSDWSLQSAPFHERA